MAKALIIVESPAKAKTIAKFAGRGYKVLASAGHLRDLPKSQLGVNVEDGFTPKYVTIKGKAKIIKELRDGAKKVEKIYLAPDPDREGEAIAWHLAHLLGNGKASSNGDGRIQRLTIFEITKQAVQEALKSPRQIDLNKVNAQQARRIMDRLVGYLVSPVLWQTIRYGLSAGRVQSVALRMICEREKEIEAFIPQEYWTIEARLKAPSGRIHARLERIGEAKPEIRSEAEAKEVLERLHGRPFNVAEVRRQERRRNPLPPFITSTLQQEAYNRLHFSSKKTMALAQQLYEGVDTDEGTVGLITYMRTDSVRLADEAVASARTLIPALFPAVPEGSYLPDEAPVYKSKSGARTQDAHEAVRPTDAARTPDAVKKHLTPDLWKLYDLIWKRFMASQMSPGVDVVTSVDIAAGDHLFRASGTHVHFDGYRKLYATPRTKEEEEDEPLADLPSLENGQRLSVMHVDPHQHFTEPPPRYTEGSLVKALEENGIGRPSTYATIVTTITTRDYVTKDGGQLVPSELGRKVTDLLVEIFPGVFDVAFTASMEDELDRVESGDDEWVKVLTDFYGPFSDQLSEAKERREELRSAIQEESEHLCEQCGARLVKKFGRNGPFLACPNYPNCRFTRPLGEEAQAMVLDEVCPTCGAQMVVKRGRFGRFAACSNYPNCKTTGPIKTGAHCPEPGCEGQIVERTTKRGRVFFGCSEYPKCKFATWDRPVASPCPQCGAAFRIEKETKAKGRHYRCLACKAEEPVPAQTSA